MKHFHHENVLELLGVCIEDDSNPLVLLPFMPHGDLLNYLHDDNNVGVSAIITEPQHDKTGEVYSKYSDQSGQPLSLTRIFAVYMYFNCSVVTKLAACGQQKL